MLLALLEEAGCERVDLGIARDDERRSSSRRSRTRVDACDALVTSGAVSVGDYDFVKVVLERLRARGADVDAGRDQAGEAARVRGARRACPVFGLPGNPVSSRVSFELFARPALRQMMGHASRRAGPSRAAPAPSTRSRRRPDGKLHLDRVRVRGTRRRLRRASGPAARRATCSRAWRPPTGSRCFDDGDGVEAGDPVRVMLLDAPADH